MSLDVVTRIAREQLNPCQYIGPALISHHLPYWKKRFALDCQFTPPAIPTSQVLVTAQNTTHHSDTRKVVISQATDDGAMWRQICRNGLSAAALSSVREKPSSLNLPTSSESRWRTFLPDERIPYRRLQELAKLESLQVIEPA